MKEPERRLCGMHSRSACVERGRPGQVCRTPPQFPGGVSGGSTAGRLRWHLPAVRAEDGELNPPSCSSPVQAWANPAVLKLHVGWIGTDSSLGSGFAPIRIRTFARPSDRRLLSRPSERILDGRSDFADVDRRQLRPRAKAPGAEAVSAGADARAAVPLQPRLRGVREDSVPGRDPSQKPHSRAVLPRGRRVRGPRSSPSPAASRCCIRRSTRSSTGSSPARSTSISAPTRCSWRSISTSSRRRSTCPSRSTSTARARSTTTPSAARGRMTSRCGPSRRQWPRASASPRTRRFSTSADDTRMREFFDTHDGTRRRRDDGLPRLSLRESPRPGALPASPPDDAAVPTPAAQGQAHLGGSTSRRCSWSSCEGTTTSNARRGGTRPTTSSAGRSPATCSRKATRRHSRN